MTEQRRGILQVIYAKRERFRKLVFAPGEAKTFGRSERADVTLPDDELAEVHFEAAFDGLGLTVRSLGRAPQPVLANGERTMMADLHHNAVLVAGQTTLVFSLENRTPAHEEALSERPIRQQDRAQLASLRDAGVLFGVLDGAVEGRVRVLLAEAVDPHASLYEGQASAIDDEVAPYLVKFTPGSGLLERLLNEGWGRRFGIFLVSHAPHRELRRHLRRFLMVVDDETEERLYFRFYDPSVLRDFLPIATPRQRSLLLVPGLLDALHCEAEDGALIGFHATPLASSPDVETRSP